MGNKGSHLKLKITTTFCSKNLLRSTIPSVRRLPSINHIASDIEYSNPEFPPPPPSTPVHQYKLSPNITSITTVSKCHKNEKEVINIINRNHRKKKSSIGKVHVENTRGFEMGRKKKAVMSRASSSLSSMACRCSVEGIFVEDSFAVVKKSSDPYEDFRNSMVEMIMDMKMIEMKELERLLQCFLALNSQCYHGVIVRAFTNIMEELNS